MVRPSIWTLVWIATAVASSAWAAVDGKKAPENTVGGAFIIECETGQDIEPLTKAIQQQDGQVRRKFDSKLFYGISIQLANATGVTSADIRKINGVKDIWPVNLLRDTAEDMPGKQPEQQQSGHQQARRRRGPESRAAGEGLQSPWHHVLTQVDKLHAEGVSGSGIKIAIVDTGVDYTHPALGGCFGQHCRVVAGDNLAQGGKKGDPMDCNGHGTAVAGILAGYDERGGFVGIAPNATLAAYRVLDCNAVGKEDDIIAGWLKAYEDGAQIIASSTGLQGSSWAHSPAAAVASRIAASGVPCIVGNGNDQKAGLFYSMNPATGRGVVAVNSFAHKIVTRGQQRRINSNDSVTIETAGMSQFSASGPTWNLEIKPNVGAPGDDIPCPALGGGYDKCSGTSYSGPQVAGIVALIAERRRSFDPALLNSLLMATAELQKDKDDLIPVMQQGGGLVRAWDAAYATTVLEPASLAFNDTDHRVPSIKLHITNTAKSEMVYHLSNLPARTVYARHGDSFMNPEFVQATATVNLSKNSVTLAPDQSATIEVSAEDPKNLDSERLPVWSGWIAVNGSDGSSLTVPYLGLSGSLHEHRVLAPDGAELAEYKEGKEQQARVIAQGTKFKFEKNKDGAWSLSVPFTFESKLASPLLRAELVPLSPPKWLAERLVDNKTLLAFTLQGLGRHWTSLRKTSKTWNGQLESGDYVPTGDYKFRVRALRIFGDPNIESDWDVSETVQFQVGELAGDTACKIYQSGGAKMHENALFQSHEECMQAHGSVATIPVKQCRGSPLQALDGQKCPDGTTLQEWKAGMPYPTKGADKCYYFDAHCS
ncbi:subtilisin-like serine protease PR1C [Beauveria brongniartii RCEF 3172]|uniref:Subtilisin-like serine protease PR1C n=1 Tax=Beauveria brongniartii RCEF 3172 TaxID=1081107 RepID=A0A166XRU1_9HYPO|nr:subtilisin-like serine protease PR1C [Beauveria brongniartii RCEF 3172]